MKVLISDNLAPIGEQILSDTGLEVDNKAGLSPDELLKIIPDYDGLVIRSATKVTAEVIEAAPNLKVVGRAGIGLDNVDVATASKHGIIVMNAPDGNATTAAEHAIAMMVSLSRNIPQATCSMKEGKWEKKKFMGRELTGKEAEEALGRANITVNKNTVPGEPRSPFVTSGLRLGTPAITTRGFNEQDCRELAGLICDVLDDHENETVGQSVKQAAMALCRKHPVYTG